MRNSKPSHCLSQGKGGGDERKMVKEGFENQMKRVLDIDLSPLPVSPWAPWGQDNSTHSHLPTSLFSPTCIHICQQAVELYMHTQLHPHTLLHDSCIHKHVHTFTPSHLDTCFYILSSHHIPHMHSHHIVSSHILRVPDMYTVGAQ